MDKSDRKISLEHLLKLIPGTQAHLSLEQALKDLSTDTASKFSKGMPYSIWQLL